MKKETGLILFFGGLLLANRLLYPKPTQQDLQFIESSKTSGEKYGYPPPTMPRPYLVERLQLNL